MVPCDNELEVADFFSSVINLFQPINHEATPTFLGQGLHSRHDLQDCLTRSRQQSELGEKFGFLADYKCSSLVKSDEYACYGFTKRYVNYPGCNASDVAVYSQAGGGDLEFEALAIGELEMSELFKNSGFSNLEAFLPKRAEASHARQSYWDFFLENPAFIYLIATC